MSELISIAGLIAAGIAPNLARVWAWPLSTACGRHDITTPVRIAAFVAQCGHESAGFALLEESLYYRSAERIQAMWPRRVASLADAARLVARPEALANRVYADRLGNGPEASGDGWRYRGRGLIQITGRANYAELAKVLGQPYDLRPDLVAQPIHAALTAAWFWQRHGCNELADASHIDAITRTINGPAMAGAQDRNARFEAAVQAFVRADRSAEEVSHGA